METACVRPFERCEAESDHHRRNAVGGAFYSLSLFAWMGTCGLWDAGAAPAPIRRSLCPGSDSVHALHPLKLVARTVFSSLHRNRHNRVSRREAPRRHMLTAVSCS